MSSIVQHAPRFSAEDAERIAEELFGIEATARQLPSERDQNFHLAASSGHEYVLKLANSTELPAVLDFQNQAMLHIAAKRDIFDPITSIVPVILCAC
jgi:Ser/Thr protein kinase RdoA (MazF antagonist)